MTQFVIANNVNAHLAAAVPSSGAGSTTLTLDSSTNLPTLSAGQIMPLALNDAQTGLQYEVVYVTAISGVTLTVQRAQEGTGALNWNIGDFAYCAPTAGSSATAYGNPLNPFAVAAPTQASHAAPFGSVVGSFNAAYAAAIGGYPAGMMLLSANGKGLWINTVAGNTANPDTTGTGWILGATPSATFAQIAALTSNMGPIRCSDMGDSLYTWTTSAYFTGYRNVLCGEIPNNMAASPRAWELATIGGTWSTSDPKQNRVIAWYQEQGLVVSSASWVPGMGMIASLGSGNWKAPDTRNMFWRVAGTDVDTANPRLAGAHQADGINTAGTQFRAANTTWAGAGANIGAYVVYWSNTNLPAYGTAQNFGGNTETRGSNTAVSPVICI